MMVMMVTTVMLDVREMGLRQSLLMGMRMHTMLLELMTAMMTLSLLAATEAMLHMHLLPPVTQMHLL